MSPCPQALCKHRAKVPRGKKSGFRFDAQLKRRGRGRREQRGAARGRRVMDLTPWEIRRVWEMSPAHDNADGEWAQG